MFLPARKCTSSLWDSRLPFGKWPSHVYDQPYIPDCLNTCGLQIQLNPQLDITDMPLKSFYKFALPEYAPSNGEPPCINIAWISCAACVQTLCLCVLSWYGYSCC